MEENEFIDEAFEKEIGMDINTAICTLVDAGITLEDMGEITNKAKKSMTDEIDKRNIPYEYRFLLLNVMLCTMFNNSVAFHKAYSDFIKKGLDKECKSDKECNAPVA